MLHFQLRTLFLLTGLAALLLWIFVVPPQWVGLVALYILFFLLPAASIAGIVYHRGPWRAFFVGTAAPLAAFATVV